MYKVYLELVQADFLGTEVGSIITKYLSNYFLTDLIKLFFVSYMV